MPEKHIGKVVQITGPIPGHPLQGRRVARPGLNAVELDNHGKKLVVEVAQHIGDNVARCIAMAATDGLNPVVSTLRRHRRPHQRTGRRCPPGSACSICWVSLSMSSPRPKNVEHWPIHRAAPAFDEQESSTEILETGIKGSLT